MGFACKSAFERTRFLRFGKTGLIVAEIELESEEQTFVKPEWLGEEVSKVSRYLNVELSKLPYKAWTAEQKA